MIKRVGGPYAFRINKASAYKDLVWVVAAAKDENLDLTGQTEQALASLEESLIELGSAKDRIVSAQVYLANIDDKPIMDAVWGKWIGSDPQNWPQRACLGVDLGGNWLIEVTVIAIKSIEDSEGD